MKKGQLKSWNDAKGFGFIQSSTLDADTFVHISALKVMSRKPKVGDFIYFDIEKQPNGKTKAINCRIEGVITKPQKIHKRRYNKSSKPKNKLITILVVLAVIVFAYQRINSQIRHVPSNNIAPMAAPKAFTPPKVQFNCDGRQHCSQMNSRAEAVYFIKNCPNTKMDGDRDGIPCENDSRF